MKKEAHIQLFAHMRVDIVKIIFVFRPMRLHSHRISRDKSEEKRYVKTFTSRYSRYILNK